MVILITAQKLDELGGSQTFTFTIAKELISRGYEVEYATERDGLVGKKLKELGAKKRRSRRNYDLVVVNQHTNLELIEELNGRKVQIVHGVIEDEKPIEGIEHVAVSEEIAKKYGIETVINQPVDLEVFKPTSKPTKEGKILSLCQGEKANETLEAIAKKNKWQLTKHAKFANPTTDVAKAINESDVVVSYGRGVIESLACGRPVVVYDSRDYTPAYSDGCIEREADIVRSRACNFSGRSSQTVPTPEQIESQIKQALHMTWLTDGYRKYAEAYHDVKTVVDVLCPNN